MRVAVLASTISVAAHSPYRFIEAAAAGIRARGHEVDVVRPVGWWDRPTPCDAVVAWSEKNGSPARKVCDRVLVMDRGYGPGRMERCRVGAGAFVPDLIAHASKSQSKFYRWWGLPQTPRAVARRLSSEILLMGQVATDSAVMGEDYAGWIERAVADAHAAGLTPIWRPHPLDPIGISPVGLPRHESSISSTLAVFDRMATFSSTSAVDGIMAGLDVCAYGAKSPVWGEVPSKIAQEPSCAVPWARLAALAAVEWGIGDLASGAAFEGLL